MQYTAYVLSIILMVSILAFPSIVHASPIIRLTASEEILFGAILLIPATFVTIIVYAVIIIVRPPRFDQKRDVKWQMLLAGIPFFGVQFYAFYRMNKPKGGFLLLLAVWSLFFIVPILYDKAVGSPRLPEPSHIQRIIEWSMFTVLVIVPIYFARRWTIEHNTHIETPLSSK